MGAPGVPGTSGSQHYRAAHRHCRTPDPMWHPSCVSHPYMDPGWHRHPCQHARACKHATRVQKHAPLLPNTCSGMALLQHRDPVTSETQECMSVRVRKLPLGTLAGGQLWTQPLQPVLLLTHPHAHTATAWHTAMRPLFLPYNHHRGGSGCHLLFGCPG